MQPRLASLVVLGPLFALGCRPPPAATPPVPEAEGGSVAFVDVSVVPMDADRVVIHQTVVVRGERITAVGPANEVQVPPTARVIEGRGRFLMPGLADMHIHLDHKADLLLLVANGVTTARNMWGWPHHLRWRARTASGELLGPTIITSGPIIDGHPPARSTTIAARTPREARQAARRQQRAGYDFIKFYSRLSPATFNALAAEARRLGMPMAGHVPHAVGLDQVVKQIRGGSIEHLTGCIAALQAADSPYRDPDKRRSDKAAFFVDRARIAPLAGKIRSAGVWVVPTLVVTSKVVPTKERRALLDRAEMKYVPPLTLAAWDISKDPRWKGMTAEDFRALREGERIKARLVRAIIGQGGRILAGTDASNPFVIPGTSLHEELALLVAAGLTPFEALRSATADAALFLHMQGELGVVRAGARADLVLVEKNPLVDVANAARRVGVMVRGRWLSSDELRRRLTDLAASYSDKQDPFARLPPLSCRGAQAFRGHYEILWREKVVGAERFAVCRAADGATRVAAQATDDYDRASYRLTIEHGARGEQSLTAQSERSEGPGRLDLTVAGGIFTLRRRLPAEEREERRQSAAGASSLGGESVESLALIKHRFTSLAVGQTTRVPMRQVGLGAGLKVRSTDLEITRQAGTVTAPRGVETRHYRITTVAGGKAVLEQRLTTDAQGWPVRLETSGKYAITFRRVSP